MSFRLDDVIIDRIQMAVAMDFNDNPLYTLTQLSNATISVSAESTDAVDRDGTLIKRFWRGKTGTFSADNAMLNVNVIGAMSGQGRAVATTSNSIIMPAIKIVKAGTLTANLSAASETDNVTSTYIADSAKVVGMANNGAMSTNVYTPTTGTVTSSTFKVVDGVITLPVADSQTGLYADDQFVITYNRTVTSGYSVVNRSDKFPQTVRLLLKVLYVDPCTADTLRAGYIYLPSFQVSPEVEINLSTDGTITYSGDLQTDYCGAEKVLYKLFFAEADAEDED